jgi:hypothetical protein
VQCPKAIQFAIDGHASQDVGDAYGLGYLHQQGLDTRTTTGAAMFGMMGVFAEFERAMIQERVKAGMARAKANPTPGKLAIGRPKVDASVERRIATVRGQGMGILKVAREVGCGVSTVQRVVASGSASSRCRSRNSWQGRPRGLPLPPTGSTRWLLDCDLKDAPEAEV